MKIEFKALKDFGLSDNEITVYLEALKHDETSPFALSRATGIPRTTVYDILMNLSLRGLITMQQSDGLQKQQTKIKAKNPSVLREMINKKRSKLAELEMSIIEILPLLKGAYHKAESSADFQFFSGIDGARNVLFGQHIEETDQPIFSFENLMPMDAFGMADMNDSINETTQFRTNSTHKPKELVVLNDWARHVIGYQYRRDPNYIVAREIRYLDNPIIEIKLRITILGTRIYVACVDEDEAWGMIVNSKALSITLKSIFLSMWQGATPITKEIATTWVRSYV